MNDNRKTPTEMCALVHALCGMRWTGIKGKVKPLDLNTYIAAYKAKQTYTRSVTTDKALSQREIERRDRNAEILRLWDIGISKIKISQRLGIERHTVAKVIKIREE